MILGFCEALSVAPDRVNLFRAPNAAIESATSRAPCNEVAIPDHGIAKKPLV